MGVAIRDFFMASALGAGKTATLENYRRRFAPGIRPCRGDIPGREIWFGSVVEELPTLADRRWDMRANRLLEFAVRDSAFGASLEYLRATYAAGRVGVVLGASNTGIDEAQRLVDEWLDRGEKPAEFDFSLIELGTPAAYLQQRLSVSSPAYTISTACSSAAKAFGAAVRLIEKGVCDAVVAGGVDGRCRFAMNGFAALGALSAGRCRPLADDRDGINLGEAVALFILERGANGVRVNAVGESSDAYHATAPDPAGGGAEAAMRAALASAGLRADDVDYLNLHGTGTLANDAMELQAARRVFSPLPRLTESTKDLTGHCLGAAGAIEAALCALLIEAGEAKTAMSNSFAFGGSNASVILSD